MGDFADMAVDQGFAEWDALDRDVADGDYEHDAAAMPSAMFPRQRPASASAPCRGCGKSSLYWLKVDGRWRLHHYTMFGKMTRPGYSLHRCGFTSDGQPIPA